MVKSKNTPAQSVTSPEVKTVATKVKPTATEAKTATATKKTFAVACNTWSGKKVNVGSEDEIVFDATGYAHGVCEKTALALQSNFNCTIKEE